MQYKTLVDIAKETLGNSEGMEFRDIFEGVRERIFDRWRSETPQEISDEKMLEAKRGELFRLLTVDGRFFHNEDGTWTALRPEIKG
ncbi:hypothetical protein HGG64_00755 [Mycoplasma phocoeninasale]|uniref:Uncharacterized protein n=1 Tax=Mycoplasma phocoeninasale TaxID=2726117 RepID=A0A858U4Q6_9MOLU|nr:hypothetical protein [Mycoplasma phocoeninasale]QJG66245.1 hypothetical protein HGG64_00755 [Mycoplasma phocoeninasale]